MDRGMAYNKCLIDQTVAIPTTLCISNLGQAYTTLDETAKGIGLWQCLTIKLVYPLWGTVGRNHNQRNVLVISLCHSRSQVQQCGTTGDTDGDRLCQTQSHTQGIEACATLIGHGIALNIRTLVEVMHDGGITAARTYHSMLYACRYEQAGQDIDILFVAIHYYI